MHTNSDKYSIIFINGFPYVQRDVGNQLLLGYDKSINAYIRKGDCKLSANCLYMKDQQPLQHLLEIIQHYGDSYDSRRTLMPSIT